LIQKYEKSLALVLVLKIMEVLVLVLVLTTKSYLHHCLERSWTPNIGGFNEFFAILGCDTHFKGELRRKHSRQTRTTCAWNVQH